MFEFFAWLKMFPDAMKRLFSTVYSTYIVNFIRYWYYLMTVPAIYVVYKLLNALDSSGILDKFNNIVTGMLTTITTISDKCFPLIADLKSMIACINGVN